MGAAPDNFPFSYCNINPQEPILTSGASHQEHNAPAASRYVVVVIEAARRAERLAACNDTPPF